MVLKKLSGIIFEIKPHGERDRMLTVFTVENGLVRILAKGVRKITSRRGSHLDLLNLVSMETEESGSGGGILYLREISTSEGFPHIKKNPAAFAAACLAASFLIKNIPFQSPQHKVFSLTIDFFESLECEKPAPDFANRRQILTTYFLKILYELGHLPNRLPAAAVKSTLSKRLSEMDPQFILLARRTLGTFSSLEMTRSN